MIIAAGSKPVKLSIFPDTDERIWDSTDALSLKAVPEKLLIVGGGIIGLEMATVYSALGSSVTVVEALDQIIPGADADIVKPLYRKLKKKLEKIMLETKVTGIETEGEKLTVLMNDKKGRDIKLDFDSILVAVGRKPNTDLIEASNAGLEIDEKGFIKVNEKTENNISGIYAIGDITGKSMLAHKASHQGKTAAEVIFRSQVLNSPRQQYHQVHIHPLEVAWGRD